MKKFTLLWIILAILILSYVVMVDSKNWSRILPLKEVPVSPENNPKFQAWINYNAPDHAFSVKMPVVPQTAEDQVKGRKYTMYVAEELGGSIFTVSLIQFPKELIHTQRDGILQALMKEMVASQPTNELKNLEKGEFLGNEALTFSIEGKNLYIEARVFLVGDTAYLLSRLSSQSDADTHAFDYFVNNFSLENK